MSPKEYNRAQVSSKNVDGLAALLPGENENSTDFFIKKKVNVYLSARGHARLQDNQSTKKFHRKLGGQLDSYPRAKSLQTRSNEFLENGDGSVDFMALLQPGFCE